jgi:hypothetical protein
MVTLIILLVKALNNTLLNVNVDTLICFCIMGIAAEIIFIWMPIINLNKWYKKMSYFKYIFTTLF